MWADRTDTLHNAQAQAQSTSMEMGKVRPQITSAPFLPQSGEGWSLSASEKHNHEVLFNSYNSYTG